MKVTFAPRGILQIDEARIVYRNFSGEESQFNRKGDRNFSLVIPDEELAQKLAEEGWNVKIRPAREEGEDPFIHLPVKVKFNDRGPNVYLITNGQRNKLDEETVGLLDSVDIVNVDLDIRPYDWEMNGKTGRTAYLQAIMVTQEVNRFEARFAEEEFPGNDEMPF